MMTALAAVLAAAALDPDLAWWPAPQREAELAYEGALNDVPALESLSAYHVLLGSGPHRAGTVGDRRVIASIEEAFGDMGLEIETFDFEAYMPLPRSASLAILSPRIIPLKLTEDVLAEDPDTADPALDWGWNAYSADGNVRAGVVYANYGTKEDFERLREEGIDATGRIVIARYGKNFRGYKAKFAEAAGAAGLILYTDPADSGYGKGAPYPEGGWANESSIQRGSIKTLDYPGDPLTPFEPALPGSSRAFPAHLPLPVIPVQPVGWRAASRILSLMEGPEAPESWQGGLPFPYRLTGGPTLTVRLQVEQDRGWRLSSNVIGTLRGATRPDEKVIIGCHHDAWGFGAADPLAGTIVLMECARSFSELAKRGIRPARTVVFAAWGAEEFGIIGSVEWCEANRDQLLASAVAYVNLDMAAMGPNFSCAASPTLKGLIASAARGVPWAGDAAQPVYDTWVASSSTVPGAPPFGNLGGGSDHVGFYCHLGIPSAGLGGTGSDGVSYHTNYDTLRWYRQVVGGYEPALMLTRITNLIAARLAQAPLLPLDPVQYATDARAHLDGLRARAREIGMTPDFEPLERAIGEYESAAVPVWKRLRQTIAAGSAAPATVEEANGFLLAAERAWLHEPGLPGRPWYRSLYAAPDPDSGYSAWVLPALRAAVEDGDPEALARAQALYVAVFEKLLAGIDGVEAALAQNGSR